MSQQIGIAPDRAREVGVVLRGEGEVADRRGAVGRLAQRAEPREGQQDSERFPRLTHWRGHRAQSRPNFSLLAFLFSLQLVEAAGIEPASEEDGSLASTCLAFI